MVNMLEPTHMRKLICVFIVNIWNVTPSQIGTSQAKMSFIILLHMINAILIFYNRHREYRNTW